MKTSRKTDKLPENSNPKGGYLLRPATLGFLNGYCILHPAAMVIFRLLEGPHHAAGGGDLSRLAWMSIVHSFQLGMLPMGLAFGAVGAAVGLVYGSLSRTIKRQRDRLGHQLAQNKALVLELQRKADLLLKQNERLVELERMKSRTTHFLVHDFKTQLNCIAGFANLLLENENGRASAEDRDALVRIRRQAKGMLSSVNNLLDIARLEDTPTLRTDSVSPAEFFAAVADDVAFAGRDYHIAVDPSAEGCPPVNGEPQLIRRVLLNLVSNAIKHNRPGTHVTLGARPGPGGNEVVFTCSDDGDGISPDHLARLFEPFQTGDHAPAESTGLGLAFARSAVEAHGGRIWCESSPGQGARFFVALPCDRSREMTDQQRSRNRILVVEDEPDFAAFMASLLRGLGYRVDTAHDGEEALSRVQACPPDAITLDVQMPRKSGLLFYRQLKSQEALRAIPVIVVTGLPREDPDWDGFIHTFLDVDHLPHPEAYLEKPVEPDALARLISEVLEQQQTA